MTLMYIFAVAGTVMFASFSKSNRTDLKYKQSFRFDQDFCHLSYEMWRLLIVIGK